MTTKKIIIYVIAILLVSTFLAGFWPRLQGYLQYKKDIKFEEALLAPYKQDTYGGKTPEETWDMFLAALNKGDLDLASKYFRVPSQEEWKNDLYKMRDENTLADKIKKWSEYKNKWKKVESRDNIEGFETFTFDEYIDKPFTKDFSDGAGGTIRKTMPAGYYSVGVYFIFNSYTNVWKLDAM